MVGGTVEVRRIQPVLGEGLGPIMKAIFPGIITFPYGEMISFLVILPYVSVTKYRLRLLMIGVGIAAFLLTTISFLTISTIGVDTMHGPISPFLVLPEWFPLAILLNGLMRLSCLLCCLLF